MKTLALLSLFMLSVACVNTTQQVLNITGGVLVGIAEEEHLDYLAQCIKDVGRGGYDIYYMVEDFIVGDFEHVREGLWYLGDLLEMVADAMYQCDEAGNVDIPELGEMAEIFKHPEDLLVQMGEDILLYHKSIKEDIYDGIDYYDIEEYFLAGESWGKAAALVFFGKKFSPFSTVNEDVYNAYVTIAGYAARQGAPSSTLQSLYQVLPSYGQDFASGMKKIYEPKRYFSSNEDYTFFLHQIALVLANAGFQIQKDGGLLQKEDLSYHYSGIHYVTPEEITFDITQYILASQNAYEGKSFKSVGAFLGEVEILIKSARASQTTQ